ncbi:MAG: hypothetical protein EA367_19605 [Leptolyngbya sp. DLM2.Bin15]|nr:MAG: hypothetical protein EA367_19605 [Leptolyngbya sp. DLM2.Bin15]
MRTKSEDFLGRIDISEVRNVLHSIVTKMYGGRIDALVHEPMFHYVYYRTQGVMLQIFLNTLEEIYNGDYGIDPDENPTPYRQALQDLNHGAIMPACALAWITTDHWRWHAQTAYKDTNPNLQYGFILKYPEPVARAAAYAANLHRPALEASLTDVETQTIEAHALSRAQCLDANFAIGKEILYGTSDDHFI